MQEAIKEYSTIFKHLNTLYAEFDELNDYCQTFIQENFLKNDTDKLNIERTSGEMKGKIQSITYRQFFDEFRHLKHQPQYRTLCKEHFPDFYEKFDRLEALDLELERFWEDNFQINSESVTLRNMWKLIDTVVETKLKK